MPASDPRPFLSIIAWPDGWSREDGAMFLAEVEVMDLATLRLNLGRLPPSIVGQIDVEPAQRAIEGITAVGGDAFAPTFADLAELGPTQKIRDLELGNGELIATLWGTGETTRIPFESVRTLIRAHLWGSEVKRLPSTRGPGFILSPGVAMAGVAGLAVAHAVGYAESSRDTERRTVSSDKLDIHTSDGHIYQIDGDRFAFQVLGDLRGYTDRTNMDQLCELLAHVSPDETVDPFFSLWSAPAGHQRLSQHLPNMRRNGEDPAFAFYSRWASLMYRHLAARYS